MPFPKTKIKMKKLFYLLLLLPLGFLASCHDGDKDLPDVTIKVELDNVAPANSEYYLVKGDTLVVDGVSIASNTNKNAAISYVRYYWNFLPIGGSIIAPYSAVFVPSAYRPDYNVLSLYIDVLQEGKPLSYSMIDIKINMVDSVGAIPGGVQPGKCVLEYNSSREEYDK